MRNLPNFKLALTSRSGEAMVDKSANAPKPCLLSVEIRIPAPAGDFQLAGIASSTKRVTKNISTQPVLWSSGDKN